jgi:hypothetical protein
LKQSALEDFLTILATTPIDYDAVKTPEKSLSFEEKFQMDNMRSFNILFFTDSLKRFVESLDYFCIAYDWAYKLVRYEDPLSTLKVFYLGMITILWFEWMITFLLVVLAVFSVYNKYHKR